MGYIGKIGDTIDYYRVNVARISQVELAKRSGLSRGYLNDVIHGRKGAEIKTIRAIAKGLGIDHNLLLDENLEERWTAQEIEWVRLIKLAEEQGRTDTLSTFFKVLEQELSSATQSHATSGGGPVGGGDPPLKKRRPSVA